MSFREFASAPLCHIGKSVKNIQIGGKFSQILTNEPQVLTVNPYSAMNPHYFMVASGKKAEAYASLLAGRAAA
jgi:hypothetical protein